jgi:hypothetical protein
MSLRVSNTQINAQGMEGICKLWNCLVPLLIECGPFHVLVIVVSNRVIFFFDGISKRFPSGSVPNIPNSFYGFFLKVSIPSMFDMGGLLKEKKLADIFHIGKIVDR